MLSSLAPGQILGPLTASDTICQMRKTKTKMINFFCSTILFHQVLIDSHPGDVCCAACVRCEMAPRKQYVIIISSDMSDGDTVSSSVKSLPGARAPSDSVRGQGSGPGPGNYQTRRLISPHNPRYPGDQGSVTHRGCNEAQFDAVTPLLFSPFPKFGSLFIFWCGKISSSHYS